MAIYVTGDTHGDLSRLFLCDERDNNIFGTEDVIFILGDFGVLFNNVPTPKEERILTKLANKPYITMVLDGNHENHSRLYDLPDNTIFGGKVGVFKEGKVFHCRRGEIYTIQDKKIFTFGGATSIDRYLRVPGVSWWKEEVPSPAEMDHGLQMLEDNDNKVDFILAHTAPESIAQLLISMLRSFYKDPDPTRKYLDHICHTVKFSNFYCGHWHVEYDFNEYHFLYESIRKIA
jgi:hypothetical protein